MSLSQLPRKEEIHFNLIRNNYHEFYLRCFSESDELMSLSSARLRIEVKESANEDAEVLWYWDTDEDDAEKTFILHSSSYGDQLGVLESAAYFFFSQSLTETVLSDAEYVHQVDYYAPGTGRKYTIYDGTIRIADQVIKYPEA